ncbi:hypothetical protein ACFL0V_02490 [Nanoarchaeota archaeon]
MSWLLPTHNVPVGITLRYKGVFDYNMLGKIIIKWFKDHKMRLLEGKHKHKMSCPHGFEIERTFIGERKIDDFIKYHANVNLHFWDAHEVDAVKDGKQVKLWKGRIEIKTGLKIEIDYQNKWNPPYKSKLLAFLGNYVLKKELIVKHGDPHYFDLLRLHTKMKEHLGAETTANVF